MSTNPNRGQQPDPADRYGGYGGYTPSNAADDPYGAYTPPASANSQRSDPNYVYGQQGTQQSYGQSQAGQQQMYQPPLSASRGRNRSQSTYGTAATTGPSTSRQSSRRFAFFSYLGACFTGIFFFFFKRNDPYVRYHAAQSVVTFTPIFGVLLLINILHGLLGWIPILGWLLGLLFGLVSTVILVIAAILWLTLMITSFLGITIRIPFVSTYADALIARFSPKRTV